MVAGAVAGFRPAGAAVVRPFLRLYGLLAAGSLLLASAFPLHGRGVSAAAAPVWLYQQLAGQVDGRACSSFPVCSLYARQALRRHGLLTGSWLMLDRLIHEGDDLRHGPWILAADGKRLYDPLARNDFWLKRR